MLSILAHCTALTLFGQGLLYWR